MSDLSKTYYMMNRLYLSEDAVSEGLTKGNLSGSLYKKDSKNSYYNNAQKRLATLKRVLEGNEKDFYRRLGFDTSVPLGQMFEKLANDFDVIFNNTVLKLASKGTSSPFIRYYEKTHQLNDNKFTANELLQIFDFDTILKDSVAANVGDLTVDSAQMVAGFIQNAANAGRRMRQPYKAINSSYSEKRKSSIEKRRGYKMSSVFRIFIISEEGEISIKPGEKDFSLFENFSKDLYVYFLNKIENTDNIAKLSYTEKKARNILKNRDLESTNIRENVAEAFYDYAKNLDSYMAERMRKYLLSSSIGINANILGIAGAIGEAAAAIAMEELGKKYPALRDPQLVGELADIATKKKISVDLLAKVLGKYFNFQIKNFALKSSGSKTIKRTYTIPGLVKSWNVPFGEAIIELFGAYQFNQPNGSGRFALHGAVAGAVESTKDLLLSYSDKMLGVDRTFQADSPIGDLAKQGLHINTMFIVSGRLVPPSVMVGALMDSLEVGTESMNSNISFTAPINAGKHTYGYYRPAINERYQGHGFVDSSAEQAARLIKANVILEVNYNTLIQSAKARVR